MAQEAGVATLSGNTVGCASLITSLTSFAKWQKN